jgi:predicted alpha/beta hydrolase
MPPEDGERWSVMAGGAELTLRAYADGAAPVIVVWPALGVPARFYRPLVGPFREHGFGVVLADYRGQGENRPRITRSDRFGYHDLATADFPAVIAEVKNRCPGQPVLLLGHSLGGQAGVTYAAANPDELAGIALVAAGTPYFRAYPPLPGARILASVQSVHAISALVGYWPGDRLRFAGRQSKVLLADWARINRTGRFSFTRPGGGRTAYDEDIAKLKLPVLAVSVEGDSYAPPSAVDHLCGKLREADVTRWHYEKKLDHFRWVKEAEPIAAKLGEWFR